MNEKKLQRKREKKKAKRKEKASQLTQQKNSANGIPLNSPTITVKFANVVTLETVGPLVLASWSVPESLSEALRKAGMSVPPPVNGFMLVDTGAKRTCIADYAAKKLGLIPIGTATSYGAHGLQQSDRYFAQFGLNVKDDNAKQTIRMANDIDTLGIPGLKESFDQFGIQDPETGQMAVVIGLIGRDFLKHCRLVYDGAGASITIELKLGTMNNRANLSV